jgi:hypothetical protein
MNHTVNKTLAAAYYRQNAGFFLFLFVVFFGIVAPSQQLAYHYALIRGILAAPAFMFVVAIAWLLYAGKVFRFVTRVIDSREGLVLYQLKSLPPGHCYRVLLRVQSVAFLPVSVYALAIAGVAAYQGAWASALLVPVFVALICGLSAAGYYRRLEHPGAFRDGLSRQRRTQRTPYWSILLRYLFDDNLGLLTTIKIFGCLLLYLLLRLQTPGDYDLRMPYFVFSVALFGHGILLFRCRRLEETRLICYRALPVVLRKRFGQYCLFYFLLLLPEILVLGWLTPDPIRFIDTLELVVSGYSLLILLNSFLFVIALRAGDFLKLCLVIFGILYGCVLGGFLIAMSGFFFFTAAVLFFRGYYRYELR